MPNKTSKTPKNFLKAICRGCLRINQTILSELPIRIPSVEEQQSIVRQLDALQAETQKIRSYLSAKKIYDLEELKKIHVAKGICGGIEN
jgi:type I restriction enzyme, S subunit